MSDASPMRPLRMRYIHRPTNSAMGMVQAMVNRPQDEPGITQDDPSGRCSVSPPSAFTTTRPSPASALTMMNRIAMAAVVPATGPISARAISASERPLRRIENASTRKSCTAPASTTPITSHSRPGR